MRTLFWRFETGPSDEDFQTEDLDCCPDGGYTVGGDGCLQFTSPFSRGGDYRGNQQVGPVSFTGRLRFRRLWRGRVTHKFVAEFENGRVVSGPRPDCD